MACELKGKTGNPICSDDLADLKDNTIIMDQYINSRELTVPDRLGVDRKTWAGIEKDAQDNIDGFEDLINDKIIAQGGVEIANEWGDSLEKVISQKFLTQFKDKLRFLSEIDSPNPLQYACDIGGFWVLDSEYSETSVLITKNVHFHCIDAEFIKPDGSEYIQDGVANANVIFEVVSPCSVVFTGSFTFNGNNQGQEEYSLGGFLRSLSVGANISLNGGVFEEGTYFYIYVRGGQKGDPITTNLKITKCKFKSARSGTGKDDPIYPQNSLGYSPSYVIVHDNVAVETDDFNAEYIGEDSIGVYAPIAMWFSFYGTSATAGTPSLYMRGTTRLKGLGRKSQDYDGGGYMNNGLGVIDFYGLCDSLVVDEVNADDCLNEVIRSKNATKVFTVKSGYIKNCWGGIQVSPSTQGYVRTIVNIGDVTFDGGELPKLYIVGNSASNKVGIANISGVSISGDLKNTSNRNILNSGAVELRNIEIANIENSEILDSVASGLYATFTDILNVENSVIKDSLGVEVLILSENSSNNFTRVTVSHDNENNAVMIRGRNSREFFDNCKIESNQSHAIVKTEGGHIVVTASKCDLGTNLTNFVRVSSPAGVETRGAITFNVLNLDSSPILTFGDTKLHVSNNNFEPDMIVYNVNP